MSANEVRSCYHLHHCQCDVARCTEAALPYRSTCPACSEDCHGHEEPNAEGFCVPFPGEIVDDEADATFVFGKRGYPGSSARNFGRDRTDDFEARVQRIREMMEGGLLTNPNVDYMEILRDAASRRRG